MCLIKQAVEIGNCCNAVAMAIAPRTPTQLQQGTNSNNQQLGNKTGTFFLPRIDDMGMTRAE